MTARVRVGGRWLDSIAPVGDVVDSTILRYEGFSGDYEASCTWLARSDFAAAQVKRGALFEVIEAGMRTWGGWLAEPEIRDGAISLHAYGFGAMAEDWPALSGSGPSIALSSVPNTVIDDAILHRALPWRRYDSIGALALGGTDEQTTIATLLDRAAKRAGKYWRVDSFGEVTLFQDPASYSSGMVPWMVPPGSGYLGTADDEYVTHMYGRYVSSVDGTTGEPNGWGFVEASDAEMAAQFGRKSVTLDLTPLGLITSSVAQQDVDGRFARVGARMGWTNGIELTPQNLSKPGWGSASPMSVRAGQMLHIPGVRDARSSATYRTSVEVTLGRVTRHHAENRATALPLGFVPRDFSGALQVSKPDQLEVA